MNASINDRKIIALVPMRHNSERVPSKNYRSFAGKPLYYHIIKNLISCPLVSQVVVDTDSPIIKDGIMKAFPNVILIERPEHLRDGKIPMNEVLLYDVNKVKADYFLQTHSTNPLLQSQTISRAIQFFLTNLPAYDALFSVTKLQVRLWDEQVRPINHDPSILLRTQDLPPIFEENSCLYIFNKKTLEDTHSRIGRNPFLFEIDRLEAWDIDDELDFSLAELLYSKYYSKEGKLK